MKKRKQSHVFSDAGDIITLFTKGIFIGLAMLAFAVAQYEWMW